MGKSTAAAEALAQCRAILSQPTKASQVPDWKLCGKRTVVMPWINGTFRHYKVRIW